MSRGSEHDEDVEGEAKEKEGEAKEEGEGSKADDETPEERQAEVLEQLKARERLLAQPRLGSL